MKIAYLINLYPMPSQTFIRREIQSLERSGFSVERFAIRSFPSQLVDTQDMEEKEKTQYLLGRGFLGLLQATLWTMVSRPVPFIKALILATQLARRSGRGLVLHWIYLAEACVLLSALRRTSCEHVHVHFGSNSTDVALLTRILGGPTYSFTIHGPEEFDRPAQLSLGTKVEHAAFVVTVCEFGRSQLFRWSSFEHWSKIHVVHCGVDQSYLNRQPTPVPDINQIVCVGRLNEQKGQLRLLQALSLLQKQGVSFKAILAGDGPMRKELENEIQSSGLQDTVTITGWLNGEQVLQYLLDSRAMVLPSFAEGLPVVIMEALALGRPVISTYVAGIPELVHPGENGWLVPAGSIADLARAIAEVLKTPPETLTRMGADGVRSVATQHDVNREAEKIAKLIRGR